MWEREAEFKAELERSSKKGSRGSIENVARIAVEDHKQSYKHVVALMERQFRKVKGQQQVNVLYAVSKLLRQAHRELRSKSKYGERFGQVLPKMLESAAELEQDQQEAVRKLVKAWRTEGILSASDLADISKVLPLKTGGEETSSAGMRTAAGPAGAGTSGVSMSVSMVPSPLEASTQGPRPPSSASLVNGAAAVFASLAAVPGAAPAPGVLGAPALGSQGEATSAPAAVSVGGDSVSAPTPTDSLYDPFSADSGADVAAGAPALPPLPLGLQYKSNGIHGGAADGGAPPPPPPPPSTSAAAGAAAPPRPRRNFGAAVKGRSRLGVTPSPQSPAVAPADAVAANGSLDTALQPPPPPPPPPALPAPVQASVLPPWHQQQGQHTGLMPDSNMPAAMHMQVPPPPPPPQRQHASIPGVGTSALPTAQVPAAATSMSTGQESLPSKRARVGVAGDVSVHAHGNEHARGNEHADASGEELRRKQREDGRQQQQHGQQDQQREEQQRQERERQQQEQQRREQLAKQQQAAQQKLDEWQRQEEERRQAQQQQGAQRHLQPPATANGFSAGEHAAPGPAVAAGSSPAAPDRLASQAGAASSGAARPIEVPVSGADEADPAAASVAPEPTAVPAAAAASVKPDALSAPAPCGVGTAETSSGAGNADAAGGGAAAATDNEDDDLLRLAMQEPLVPGLVTHDNDSHDIWSIFK